MPRRLDIDDPNEFFAQAPVGTPPKQPDIEDPNEFFKQQEPIVKKRPKTLFKGLQKMAGLGSAMKQTKKERDYDKAATLHESSMDILNEILQTGGTRGREKAMESFTKHPSRMLSPPPWGTKETRKEGKTTERFLPWMGREQIEEGGVIVPREVKPFSLIEGEMAPGPEEREKLRLRARTTRGPALVPGGPVTPGEEAEGKRMEEEARVRKKVPSWMAEYMTTHGPPTAAQPPLPEEKPVVGAIGEFLMIPLSTAAGGAQTVYRLVKDIAGMANEFFGGQPYEEMPTEHIFEPLKRGITQRGGGVFSSDLITEVATDALGRELTGGEHIAAQIAGLAVDLVFGGKVYPQFGGGPQAKNLGRQIERAFKRAGYSGEIPLDAAKLRRIAEMPSMADRMSSATGVISRVAKQLPGVSDDFAKVAYDQALKIWGKEGSKFGKRGMMFGEKEVVPLLPARKVPERIKGFRRGGALQGKVPTPLTGLLERAQWGAGATEATIQSMRESNALRNTMAEKSGELVEQLRKQPKAIRKEMSKYLDSVAAKTQLGKESEPILGQLASVEDDIAAITVGGMPEGEVSLHQLRMTKRDLQSQLFAKQTGFETNLIKNGFATSDDLANRFSRFTPEQRELLGAYRQSMDDWFALDQKMGVNFDYRKDVVSRLETAISKGRRAKTVAAIGVPAGPSTKPGFTQHRLGVEQGIAIGQKLPPRGQGKWWGKALPEKMKQREQFTTDLAEGYADYAVANSIVTSNAHTENLMVERVGKLLEKGRHYVGHDSGGKPVLSKRWADLAEREGLTAYTASMGKNKGKVYFMPAGDIRMLQKMANPEELSKFFRNWRKFSNWWKARATIWRPGFAMRNIFAGNLYQMWLADVDIIRSGSAASKIMQYRWSRAKDGQLAQVMTRKMFGLGKPITGAEKVYGKPIAQWADEMEKMGVFSSGYAGAELTKPTGRIWNPFGAGFGWTRGVRKVNVVGEDFGHATTYVDRVRKGYSPREAVAAGKKHLFGYNEITPIIQKGRHFIPFLIWPYKNAGLMMSTLLQKPGKMAKYLRAFEGIQDFDPLSPTEKFYEMTLPPKMIHSGMFRLPSYRGEEGNRGYIPTGNLTPPGAMNQLALHRPGLFLRFLGDMLHPIPKILWERMGNAPTVGSYGHFGTPYVYHEDATTDAPGFVSDAMSWLREKGYDGAYKAASVLFRPKYAPFIRMQMEKEGRDLGVGDPKAYAEEHTPAIGYTIPRWVQYLVQGVDPGMATTIRVLGRDDAYDQLFSFLLGIKPYDLTMERATRWYMQENREFNKELKDIESEEAKHFDIPTEKGLESLGR